MTHADGYAERDAALLMLEQKQQGRLRRITVGADKAYDTRISSARYGNERDAARYQERQGPLEQPGTQNHMRAWLCCQP